MQPRFKRSHLLAALLTFVATAAGLSRSASAASDVCYKGGPALANFKLNGNTFLDGTSIVLTKAVGSQSGSAMYQTKFAATADFHIQMKVRITTPAGGSPADGMAFVMHNDPSGASTIGGLGGGVGYDGIPTAVVVEFDTYVNAWDPAGPHIAITRQGQANHNATANAGLPKVLFSALNPPVDPVNGTPFNIWIDYASAQTKLSVYVSTAATKPATAALTATLNLVSELGSSFYMGYTSSTGGAWSKHEFLELYATDTGATATSSCCDADADCQGSSAGAVCDTFKHVCGTCTTSNTSQCAGATTACNVSASHNVCTTPCTGNYGAGGAAACPSANYPSCRSAGAAAGSCTACGGDYGASGSNLCGVGAPYCSGSNGYCGLCTVNADCTSAGVTHSGTLCNTTTGRCVSACTSDTDCGPLNVCLAAACAAKQPNGAAIPGGTCTAPLGARACLSGVCSTANNTCGYGNGTGSSCTAANAATVCQSGACSTAGVCIPAASGACWVDGECAAGSYCARNTFMCTPKLGAGTAIPSDGLHNGTCTPSNAAAVCLTSTCNATSNTCAAANGTPCSTGAQCTSAICGSNGVCGASNGTAGCTGANAATYCQSGACSSAGVCVPAASGSCYVDADCGAGTFCRRDNFSCVPLLNPGVAIPDDGLHGGVCTVPVATAVCATGVCNPTTNTCAAGLGAACANPAGCAVNICGANGLCGYSDGSGPCTGASASTVCQSAVCSTAGTCIPAASGSCWVDADCTDSQFCARNSFLCTPKRVPGSALPADGLHEAGCASAAAVCASGLCNATSQTCAGGLGTACASTSQCTTNVCGANGECGFATGEGPCTGSDAATICQSGRCSAAGVCAPAPAGGCWVDADCASGQYCRTDTLTCTGLLPAGTELPNDRLHDGVCSPALATAVCADGACNPTTNTCARATGLACAQAMDCAIGVCTAGVCGLPAGAGPCTSGNATAVCAGGACSTSSSACLDGPGRCWVDADCANDSFCDRTTRVCAQRLSAGSPLPNDGLHDGACTDALAAAVCTGGLCNGLTQTCGGPAGATCAAVADCANNVCGSNAKCGYPSGTGACTAGSAVTVCQSGTCGANSSLCVPADAGGCARDGDCADGQYCDASTLHCAARLAAGATLPTDDAHKTCTDGRNTACASGLCNAVAGTCGAPVGQACNAAGACAGNVCGRNQLCGLADGQPGCTAGTTAVCQSGVCAAGGVCGALGCAADADCPASAFCDGTAGLCRAKLAVGQPIPNDGLPGHQGVCTDGGAAALCASGVCNARTNACADRNGASCATGADCSQDACGSNGKCGLADGQAGCTQQTAAACQSGLCSAAGQKCLPSGGGRCAVDADCAAGTYCDGSTLTCTAKLANGAALPTDALHEGGCLPGNAQAVCASGQCNATTGTCGAPVGAACSGAAQCAAGVCAANGRCGLADGSGTCATGTATTMCQSGMCDSSLRLCRPSGAGRCLADAECAAGTYCARATLTCAPKLGSGSALPKDDVHPGTCATSGAASVCSSGTCNAVANTCALPNGSACTTAAQCTSNACGPDGLCGLPDGSVCAVASACRTSACTNGFCGVTAPPPAPPAGNTIGGSGGCGYAGRPGSGFWTLLATAGALLITRRRRLLRARRRAQRTGPRPTPA